MPDGSDADEPWVIVLAAGEGRRLGALTTSPEGTPTPKQYCSFGRGPSMIQRTLDRALRLTPRERVVVVVAQEHRGWWQNELGPCLASNVVVQPRNRGTAAGILLPLVHVLKRDSAATVVVLPSDHYVEDEGTLRSALASAIGAARAERDHLVLLGIEPDAPGADVEYGWILPGRACSTATHAVERFVEKPDGASAAELRSRGAVWNSFLFVAGGGTLLRSFGRALPQVLEPFLRELVVMPRDGGLEELYARLPVNDFSRDVLEVVPGLRLLKVPPCGWTDIGTPQRLSRFLEASTSTSNL
jgi:mannose-1-phosphate guanylyltransferase